jgi:hypothetical protein
MFVYPGRTISIAIANNGQACHMRRYSHWFAIYHALMRDVLILVLHLIVTVVQLERPGGLRSVVAESLLVKGLLWLWPLVLGLRSRSVLYLAWKWSLDS